MNGQRDTVKLLLEDGADVTANDNKGWTSLIFAANHGHRDTAELLFHHVNAKDDEGRTSLPHASRNGHRDAVELLLQHDAYIDATDG